MKTGEPSMYACVRFQTESGIVEGQEPGWLDGPVINSIQPMLPRWRKYLRIGLFGS